MKRVSIAFHINSTQTFGLNLQSIHYFICYGSHLFITSYGVAVVPVYSMKGLFFNTLINKHKIHPITRK